MFESRWAKTKEELLQDFASGALANRQIEEVTFDHKTGAIIRRKLR